MPLTFPSSPTLNQQVTTGGRTYSWNGEAWELVGSGIAGPANSLSIGTVSTGATASATITGSAPSQVLSLVLPKGDKGDAGDKGDTGAAGGVTTLNGVTGAVSIVGGANVTVTTSAATITVAAGGGGSFSWASVPASPTSAGSAGDIAYDSSYFYVRTPSLWKRAPLYAWNGDQFFANVKLLLKMDGSNGSAAFTDSSSSRRTITAYGSAQIGTAQSKFGQSGYFGGAGDYVATGSSADFDWSAGDAVIEGWFYVEDLTANRVICSTSSSADDGATAVYVSPYGQLCIDKIGVSGVSGGGGGGGAPEVTANEWHYFAAVKSGSSTYLYLNGTRIATGTASNAWSSGVAPFSVGKSYWSSASDFVGWIDDLRVTVGTNRGYGGSTITVPTAAFSDY